jgi:predicted PurR-regulated permease PerM
LVLFFIAVLLAYLIDPAVQFVQNRLRVRHRGLSVFITLFTLAMIISSILWWLIPQFMGEMSRMAGLVKVYLQNASYHGMLPEPLDNWLREFLEGKNLQAILNSTDVADAFKQLTQPVIQVFSGSINIIFGTFGLFIVLLYLIFILVDYPKLESSWPHLIPGKYRQLFEDIANDLKLSMRVYFRNQSLIALTVGVLMAIGFKIIGLPMAITLGLFIGLLNLIPYLQIIGFIPAFLLALLKSMETDQTFWQVGALVLLVIAIVQIFQDSFLVPRIMGKAYGMNPALILLSLSVWGTIMGILGMLLALPFTTLIISYYKRLIIKEERPESPFVEEKKIPHL